MESGNLPSRRRIPASSRVLDMAVRSRIARFALVLAVVLFGFAAGAGAAPLKIVVIGDSLTAGYGLAKNESFPVRLELALRAEGKDVAVINAGVSGDTSAGGLARLDWALGEGADAAIVELGANDALRGLAPANTYRNLDGILARVGAKGIPALLAGMQAPPNLGEEYVNAFAAVYTRLAEAHAVVFYPFFLEGVAARPELNQPDGIHPTAPGVDVIVKNILPDVRELIRRAEARRG